MADPMQPAGHAEHDPPRGEVRVVTQLTTAPLDVARAHDDVVHPEAGGIGVFTGVVRNHHDGAAVAHLDYEAWEEQAELALQGVAEDVAAAHPSVRAVHVAHRIGRLEIGDVSVVCAASAPHRDQALAAAGALIDEVKARVPIWKRETLVDGSVRWPACGDGTPA
jgi:molybdopterin synthase catalytic subunit